MKFVVESGSRVFDIELRRIEIPGKDRWEVVCGDKSVVLDRLDGHLLLGQSSYEYEISCDEEGLPRGILLGTKEVPVSFRALGTQLRHKLAGGPSSEKGGFCFAPMNGQVVKILRKPKDRVRKGDVILVLEAMKMENEVVAPLAGILKKLEVRAGQTVKAKDLLFQIEPDSEPQKERR